MNALTARLRITFLLLLFTTTVNATTIEYTLTNITGNTWQYDYTLTNDSLAGDIDEFTIWFDQIGYGSLAVAAAPAGWDPVFWQPGSNVGLNPGGFDGLALGSGLAPGMTLGGFSIQFDWAGGGNPGEQPFDIIDPVSYTSLDTGLTVAAAPPIPVPGAAWLLFSGLIALVSAARIRRS